MSEYFDWFFLYLDKITVCIGIFTYIAHLAWGRSAPGNMSSALSKAISSSGVPNGVAFLICAYAPEYVVKIQGSYVAFFIGGLALVSFAMLDMLKPATSQP